ncbi:O-antigen polymerase [Epilithonimonas xixisoli]|uniref:Oligosaccharide repeat unit polymerase n=1 Tax=Epilithonimonas xixisoli TaxID=1476462 RepID=A0A4V3H2C3_9FLAO|nr:O-antigen polymerase [Epilithonimonas xixisoli]TDX83017.1 oligosaccharide repeat unit polymerase [Epilithonimonas xixisoli]
MRKIFAIVMIVLGVLLFEYAPTRYDYNYSIICGVIYLILIIVYYFLKQKKNYLDFDSIFFFTYFFVTLYYPIFMFETDATRYFMFAFPFNENHIPRGSALAILGVASYMAGGLFFNDKKINIYDNIDASSNYKKIANKHLYIISLVTFLLYVFTGGYEEMKAYYSGVKIKESSGISFYFFLFCPAFLFSALIIEFYNLRNLSPKKFEKRKISLISFVTTFTILVLILLSGSRTVPLQIILLLFGVYSLYYKDINLIRFITSIFVGLILMFGIVIFRGYTQDDAFSLGDVVMDLIINNRSSYLALEIVDEKGLTFGENMISPLAAPIPFLQSFFVNYGFDENHISSSRFFTEYTLGEFDGFGLGTNIIADIYLSFDLIGVLVLMFLLGFMVAKSKFYSKSSIYYLTIYAILMSYAVFLVRAEYFYFLRYMIWALVIIFFTKSKFKFS